MIRDYLNGDVDKITPNEFSELGVYKDTFLNEAVEKLTLEDDGKVVAIIGMYKYWGDNWTGFFLMDNDISQSNIKELKKTLLWLIDLKKPKRLETHSVDCHTINRWMDFMGFECEGIRRKFMHNKDYKMWSMIWG